MINQSPNKTKVIYARWVCEELLMRGFNYIQSFQNPVKPEFLCWVFEDTEEFQDALTEITGGGARNG